MLTTTKQAMSPVTPESWGSFDHFNFLDHSFQHWTG